MTILSTHRWLTGACCLWWAWAGTAFAQEVFRSVDENGVVSFSDQPSAGAERLVLPDSAGVDEAALAAQQAVVDQQLKVARALEESRLAREEARIRRLEAVAAAEPQTVYYPVPVASRYASGLISYGSWERGRAWVGKHPWGRKDGYRGIGPDHGLHPEPFAQQPTAPSRPQRPSGGRHGGRSSALLAPP